MLPCQAPPRPKSQSDPLAARRRRENDMPTSLIEQNWMQVRAGEQRRNTYFFFCARPPRVPGLQRTISKAALL